MNDNVVNFNETIDLDNLASLTEENDILDPLTPMLEVIMGLDDNSLNEVAIEIYRGMIEGIFTKQLRAQLINQVVIGLKEGNIVKEEAIQKKEELISKFREVIEELKPSDKKRKLLYTYVDQIESIYNEAIKKYVGINIILPIVLGEDAQVPTYAHESDAAADIYSAEDITLAPHSISNLIHTHINIALPENWVAIIVPRSSIGMKTGLRLSNSQGIIDPHYRGEIGVIYDNISDSEFIIHKGDRIAQMYIMPVYRFKAKVVDELNTTDRGEGAYGSTGK